MILKVNPITSQQIRDLQEEYMDRERGLSLFPFPIFKKKRIPLLLKAMKKNSEILMELYNSFTGFYEINQKGVRKVSEITPDSEAKIIPPKLSDLEAGALCIASVSRNTKYDREVPIMYQDNKIAILQYKQNKRKRTYNLSPLIR